MSKFKSLALVFLSYVVCIAVGAYIGLALIPEQPIIVVAIADLIATLVIFAFSFGFRNSSIYDPYWSVIPIVIALYWMWESGSTLVVENAQRQWLMLGLITFWGCRLTYNWARGWSGLGQEDWRYRDLAERHGRSYWLVSLTGIHLLPTLLVFLGMVPVYFAMNSAASLQFWDYLGASIAIGGTLVEAVADEQLRTYRRDPNRATPFLSTGLWKYSRHPNYFGEISFWVGLFIVGASVAPDRILLVGLGSISMILLFVFISIPMIDKRMIASKQGYEEHCRRVSALIPWFPRTSQQ
ncbi:MAG: DUF1295 domain-containing protein [Pseudomonadota bacterium]